MEKIYRKGIMILFALAAISCETQTSEDNSSTGDPVVEGSAMEYVEEPHDENYW